MLEMLEMLELVEMLEMLEILEMLEMLVALKNSKELIGIEANAPEVAQKANVSSSLPPEHSKN